MNPVVAIHLLAAVLAIGVAVPLVRGHVKMNRWYGVRVPAAFASEEAWFDLNRYGGQLLLRWGLTIAAIAIAGAFLGKPAWLLYDWAACALILGGLALVIAKIHRYARQREKP
jgi:uncharacterized membrane protein